VLLCCCVRVEEVADVSERRYRKYPLYTSSISKRRRSGTQKTTNREPPIHSIIDNRIKSNQSHFWTLTNKTNDIRSKRDNVEIQVQNIKKREKSFSYVLFYVLPFMLWHHCTLWHDVFLLINVTRSQNITLLYHFRAYFSLLARQRWLFMRIMRVDSIRERPCGMKDVKEGNHKIRIVEKPTHHHHHADEEK